jgi:hypothetical protein
LAPVAFLLSTPMEYGDAFNRTHLRFSCLFWEAASAVRVGESQSAFHPVRAICHS